MSDFKFSQDYVIFKAKKEGVFPIKESDWSRIKRLLKCIIPNKKIFLILSSVFFGVFASAIFSLIGFSSAAELANWVMPTTWAIFSVSLLGGVCLLILDYIQKDVITYSVDDVLTEMDEIEKLFDKTEDD